MAERVRALAVGFVLLAAVVVALPIAEESARLGDEAPLTAQDALELRAQQLAQAAAFRKAAAMQQAQLGEARGPADDSKSNSRSSDDAQDSGKDATQKGAEVLADGTVVNVEPEEPQTKEASSKSEAADSRDSKDTEAKTSQATADDSKSNSRSSDDAQDSGKEQTKEASSKSEAADSRNSKDTEAKTTHVQPKNTRTPQKSHSQTLRSNGHRQVQHPVHSSASSDDTTHRVTDMDTDGLPFVQSGYHHNKPGQDTTTSAISAEPSATDGVTSTDKQASTQSADVASSDSMQLARTMDGAAAMDMDSELNKAQTDMQVVTDALGDKMKQLNKNGLKVRREQMAALASAKQVQEDINKVRATFGTTELGSSQESEQGLHQAAKIITGSTANNHQAIQRIGAKDKLNRLYDSERNAARELGQVAADANADTVFEKNAERVGKQVEEDTSQLLHALNAIPGLRLGDGKEPANADLALIDEMSKKAKAISPYDNQDAGVLSKLEKMKTSAQVENKLKNSATKELAAVTESVREQEEDVQTSMRIAKGAKKLQAAINDRLRKRHKIDELGQGEESEQSKSKKSEKSEKNASSNSVKPSAVGCASLSSDSEKVECYKNKAALQLSKAGAIAGGQASKAELASESLVAQALQKEESLKYQKSTRQQSIAQESLKKESASENSHETAQTKTKIVDKQSTSSRDSGIRNDGEDTPLHSNPEPHTEERTDESSKNAKSRISHNDTPVKGSRTADSEKKNILKVVDSLQKMSAQNHKVIESEESSIRQWKADQQSHGTD